MATQTIEDFRPQLVELFGAAHVPPLLEHAELIKASPGEVLMHDQGAVDSLYLLLDGVLAMSVEMAGHSIRLGEVAPGNWVGEVALFSASPISVSTVQVVQECHVLRIRFEDFFALAKTAPETACYLTHIMIGMLIQRLRNTINDPVLDPDGQLLMLGSISLPLEQIVPHHGVRDFFKNLLGVH